MPKITTFVYILMDFNVSFIWDRTESPQRDELGVLPKKDDARMTVGLGYEF